MKLYGYIIYDTLEYRISTKMLINIKNGKIKRLGDTKARLFNYLVEHADKKFIADETIFTQVFENNGLRCSKSYLWAMIRQVHAAFLSVGYERAPLKRYEGKGYVIESNSIKKFYVLEVANLAGVT
ncbi:hypothetical protein LZ634_22485 [Kluyvera intermedia]|uniref:hypothetical protein n=1 Tax=Kluyvera intermedia TaxID=61648 RepID=UPI001F2BC943|nr:hypothetical protein [Kluyvera intermedia]MCE9891436.1 hypothetical protein [Kluyvera intermedia]